MTKTKEAYPGEFKDNAAIEAVADALQDLEDEYRQIKERLDKARKAALEENVDDLPYVSSKVRNRLARFSGWGRKIL